MSSRKDSRTSCRDLPLYARKLTAGTFSPASMLQSLAHRPLSLQIPGLALPQGCRAIKDSMLYYWDNQIFSRRGGLCVVFGTDYWHRCKFVI